MEQLNFKSYARHAATTAILLAIYILPICTQVQKTAWRFGTSWDFISDFETGSQGILYACAGTLLFGGFVFRGWRKLAWSLLVMILGLSLVRSELYRLHWPIWPRHYSVHVYRCYFIQMVMLALIPLQVLLWKRHLPVKQWARASLAAIVACQASVVLLQFAFYRYYGPTVELPFTAGKTLLHVRDSGQIYKDAARFTGLLGSSNLLGMVLLCTWPALLPLSKTLSDKWKRWGGEFLQPLLIAMAVLALLLCYSRAAYLGLMVQGACLLLVLAFSPKHRNRRFVLSCAFFFAAIAIGLCMLPRTTSRIGAVTDMKDASLTNRLHVYKTALMLIAERPLSGWGPGFFSTLYNRFYKLPGVQWAFFDVHSCVFNTLMEIGIGGVLIGLLTLVGAYPIRLAKTMPVYAWLSLAGLAIPFISDNPTVHPGIMFPLLWLAGVWITASLEQTSSPNKAASHPASSRPAWALLALALVWGFGYFTPMESPYSRFEKELQKAWRGPTGTLAYYVKNLSTGSVWSLNADTQYPASEMARLAVAQGMVEALGEQDESLSATLAATSKDTGIEGPTRGLPYPLEPLTACNALHLMISEYDDVCANALLDSLGSETIASSTLHLTGLPARFVSGFGQRELFAAKMDTNALKSDASKTPLPKEILAYLSPRQTAYMLVNLLERKSSAALVARSALRTSPNCDGLARYLQSSGTFYHIDGISKKFKNDVLSMTRGRDYWVSCVMRTDDVPRVGVDQPSLKAMGTMGWKMCLFFADEPTFLF